MPPGGGGVGGAPDSHDAWSAASSSSEGTATAGYRMRGERAAARRGNVAAKVSRVKRELTSSVCAAAVEAPSRASNGRRYTRRSGEARVARCRSGKWP